VTIPAAHWLAAAGCVLALASCGGGDGGEGSAEPTQPAIPAGIAEDLAARSDEVAQLLGEGRTCEAAVKADELVAAVAAAGPRVPDALEPEISEVAVDLQNTINCPPPEEEKKDEEEDKGKGNGNGNGNGQGGGGEDTLTDVTTVTTG
jgi:hypothetical protein